VSRGGGPAGAVAGSRLSVRTAEHIFSCWQARAGFDRRSNFHSLRHTFATKLLRCRRSPLHAGERRVSAITSKRSDRDRGEVTRSRPGDRRRPRRPPTPCSDGRRAQRCDQRGGRSFPFFRAVARSRWRSSASCRR
jgi:hypothetical protein